MVKLCKNGPDATRVNQGVLIGSGQSHVLLRVEKASVRDHFSDLEPCVIGDVAHSYRSAYLPLQRIAGEENCTELVMLWLPNSKTLRFIFALIISSF